MLTKDSVTVSVDAVVYYRVSNATVSVANVENAHHSTRLLAQTTLRNILGTKSLHEILSDRESISNSMQVIFIKKEIGRPRLSSPKRFAKELFAAFANHWDRLPFFSESGKCFFDDFCIVLMAASSLTNT